MATIEVEIQDTTGSKGKRAEIPAGVPVSRIVVALVNKLGLPVLGPDGNTLSYKLHHKQSGKQLTDEDTLSELNIQDGDILRIQPEMTAGIDK